jgi:hypothetical protein
MEDEVEKYIISKEDVKEYFNNRLIITKEEYNKYLKMKKLYKTNVIIM